MECLGVPIDYRLRRLIRQAQPISLAENESGHARILYDFGIDLEDEDGCKCLQVCELSFGIEMAQPESEVDIVVVLLRPHSKQVFSDGFVAGRRGCATLNAVAELISAVSNGRFGFDDISIFDAIPFLDETITNKDTINKAQNTFADMIRAKQPDVVICCYKTESEDPLVLDVCRTGIGGSFQPSILGYGQSLSLLRVTAFHPSYAINFYPTCSCFRRLLTLEFTKAFALWRRDWKEERWMTDLRVICSQEASRVSRDMPSVCRPYVPL